MKIWSGSPVPWQIAYLTLFPEKMKKREQMANITHGMGQVSCESPASLSTTLTSLRNYTRSNRTKAGAAACAACCMLQTASLTCRSAEFSLWIANKLVFILQLITEVGTVGRQKNSGCLISLQWKVSYAVKKCYSVQVTPQRYFHELQNQLQTLGISSLKPKCFSQD